MLKLLQIIFVITKKTFLHLGIVQFILNFILVHEIKITVTQYSFIKIKETGASKRISGWHEGVYSIKRRSDKKLNKAGIFY